VYDPVRHIGRSRVAGCAAALTLALLAGCAGPTAQDRALFQLFWLQPQYLTARARLPDGLGVVDRPVLVMSLTETPGKPPRQASFRLAPATGRSSKAIPAFQLTSGDYGRFRAFQDRVVASISPTASIRVRLDIAYCADLAVAPGMGPPVAEVIDFENGTVLMVNPAEASARTLQPTLPPC
jgi:hypothetical protein